MYFQTQFLLNLSIFLGGRLSGDFPGSGPEETAENDAAEEVGHVVRATAAIFERLSRVSPELAKHAETFEWHTEMSS